MNREFFINIIFLLVLNLLIKPFFIFGIDRSVQNMVGEQIYGTYFSLLSFTYMFQIINDIGITNYNSREIAQHRQLLDKYFSNILSLKIILGALYFGTIFLVSGLIGYELAIWPLLFYIAINTLLFSFLAYLRSNIASLGMYRLNSLLTVLDRLLLILLCAILLWVEPFKANFNIYWFVHAQNITAFISILIAFIFIYKHLKYLKIKINVPFNLAILRGALPYALTIFLMSLYTRTDVVMIERLLSDGKQQAGIYASAYRLLDAVNMVGFFFAGLLMPMFSRLLKEGDSVRPLLRFSYQLIMVGSVSCAAAIWFYRVPIMEALYHEATPYSGDVLGILMFSFVAMCGTYIYSTLLNAAGDIGRMNRAFGFAICLNIGLNMLLIPTYKALGAAISTLITQGFVMLCTMYLSQKLLKKQSILRGSHGWVFSIFSYIILVFFIHYLIKTYFLNQNWLYPFLTAFILNALLAYIFGFLNYKQLDNILKNNTPSV
jgi:O-antigen/teichoic acid export membrane protein